jgi:hypothetical protein
MWMNRKKPKPVLDRVFEKELVRSEMLRVKGVVFLLLILGVISIARAFVTQNQKQFDYLPELFILLGVSIAYELGMYAYLKRQFNGQIRKTNIFRMLNVFIETSLPTISIFVGTETDYMGPYAAMVGPVLLVYPMFILLSVLHLRPSLSFFSGIVASAGFVSAYFWTVQRHDPELYKSSELLSLFALSYILFLLLLGAIACFVSDRMRRYVLVGLDEGKRRQSIEGDLDHARSIQQGLLPAASPRVPGYQIQGWNVPADQTGGDYFDLVITDDGKLVVNIADVSGHGIGPALVAAVSHAYARALMQNTSDPIRSILEKINALLYADLPDDRFVTFVFARLDPGTNELSFLSAGHGPSIHYNASDASITRYIADSYPLGIADSLDLEKPNVIKLNEGDLFLMFTDGLFEWANGEGKLFGVDRICEYVIENIKSTPAEIISGLHDEVRAYADGLPQLDDLTILVIKKCQNSMKSL